MKNAFAIHITLKIQVRRQENPTLLLHYINRNPFALRLNGFPYQGYEVYLVEEKQFHYIGEE